MKDLFFGFLSLGNGIWFHRWHFYRWGYRKEPFKKFVRQWRFHNLKTGYSRDL